MLTNSDPPELAQHNQPLHNQQRQQNAAMSYSYGPTVVYPVTAFSMGEPFGYEAKENFAALQQGLHAMPVKVRLVGSLRPVNAATEPSACQVLTFGLCTAGHLRCVRGGQL